MNSQYIASTWAPLSKVSVHLPKTLNNCKTVDLPGKKPNCLLDRAFIFLRNSSKVSLTNNSLILQIMLIKLIGQ